MSRHSTGITIALTVAIAIGLSFAPVPDVFRPFPGLVKDPVDTVVAAVLPQRGGSLKRQDAITGAPELAQADSNADALPVEDEASLPAALNDADELNGEALPPAVALGAAEARNVRKLERWAKKVGAAHVDLEHPEALEPFFQKLEALQRGEQPTPVRVVHLGDSQIASDHITDVIRRRLQLRYGSGGPGFLFVDRPSKFSGRAVRNGEASDGWEVVKLTDKTRDGMLGFSGVRFVSRTAQHTRFDVASSNIAELFFVTSPKGGTLDVKADDTHLSHVFTQFMDTELAFSRLKLPEGARSLRLDTADGEVNLLGVALESGGPGIVYDTVGLPGALFEVYLRGKEKFFVSQLAHRDPSLVVLMLGGNEAYEIGRGWQTLDDARGNARKLVDRVKKAAPEAACLLMGPMDAGIRTVSGEIDPRPNTREVGAMIREVAAEKGCAFWDAAAAMGGIGSVPKWLELGLFNQDLIHPRSSGADVLGHLFDFALERARATRAGATNLHFAEPTGLENAPGVSKTIEKLAALKKEKSAAPSVRVVQLGASHTAGHMFTDTVRSELAKKFGPAGRGFIAAGRPSPRLVPDVKREVEGDWEFPDARGDTEAEPWGLTGVRAVGQPGAKLKIAFGQAERGRNAPAELSLYYLETRDMGALEVRIDGDLVAELGPARAGNEAVPVSAKQPRASANKGRVRPTRDAHPGANPPQPPSPFADARARVVTWPVTGTSHTLEVTNAGGGQVVVFGASLDQPQGGVVWDALGLPGATAITADGYDKPSFEEQLRARKADLYVLFFGTNESAMEGFDAEVLREHERSLIATMKRASPEAECLILGPTDRQDAPYLDETVRVLREVAQEAGCAFWSSRWAMGGPRAMARWQSMQPPLADADGVHLTKEGYEALGQMLVDDLLAEAH